MAKTSRLLKNRKFLISIYLLILTSVGILIGLLIVLYEQNKGTYSSDIEKYDSIQEELASYKSDYEFKLEEISTIEKSNVGDSELTTDEIDKLVDLHTSAKAILTNVILINDSVLNLELDESKYSIARSSIQSAQEAQTNHNEYINVLYKHRMIASYVENLEKALNCFSKIDTDGTSSQISFNAEGCKTVLDQAYNQLPNDYAFEKTEEYHKELKEYWNYTILLNKEVEAGNQDKVKEFSKKVEQSSQRRVVLQGESTSEIRDYLEYIYSEISQD